jgi:hypothetical protein
MVQESARMRVLPHATASRNQVIAGYRHKAKKAGREFALTVPQFERIAASPCFYCGSLPTNVHRSPHASGDYVYNGLDRVDSRKAYTVSNTIACCKACNLAKGARSQGEFISWLLRCVTHLSATAMAGIWKSTTDSGTGSKK